MKGKTRKFSKTRTIELPYIADLTEFDFPNSELVFAFVFAAGTDFVPIQRTFEKLLRSFGYEPCTIRLSDHLKNFTFKGFKLVGSPEDERIRTRMRAANALCRRAKRKDYMGLAAVTEILKLRKIDPNTSMPRGRTAFILLSLKRPEEVSLLRKIYGSGFYLIGVFASQESRQAFLLRRNARRNRVRELLEIDQLEKDEYGQKTSQTFPLADVFITQSDSSGLERFLRVLFCDPYITPTRDERAMFLAYASSLRSAQLGRQVGACIVSEFGSVIGVGCNEVPKFGGGLYWPGPGDKRDHVLKCDSNDKEILKIAERLIGGLGRYLKKSHVLDLRGLIEAALDITEYGRAVHAEMDALITCARCGSNPQNGTVYTTTFPCHNCTRHLITSGIRRVVYIEPYVKSHAMDLHPDAITLQDPESAGGRARQKVAFEPFVGIGPRRFFDLFSLNLSSGYRIRRKLDGRTIRWGSTKHSAIPRVPMHPNSYLDREKLAASQMKKAW